MIFRCQTGTVVTGLDGLALHTGLIAVRALAVVYSAGFARTFHGSVLRGSLLAPAPSV